MSIKMPTSYQAQTIHRLKKCIQTVRACLLLAQRLRDETVEGLEQEGQRRIKGHEVLYSQRKACGVAHCSQLKLLEHATVYGVEHSSQLERAPGQIDRG